MPYLFPADTSDSVEERTVVVGIVTQSNFLNYISPDIYLYLKEVGAKVAFPRHVIIVALVSVIAFSLYLK